MASRVLDDNQLFFAVPDKLAGFRLQRLEVFNWGTFHGKVWTLRVNGENTLVTGDIGSGKSSLVDAVTTLLVAPQRITYNKAAGAEGKERSLRSYVMGYYKSERGELGYSAKPVALRDQTANTYSVILGSFQNEALGMTVTLAQVFWMKSGQEQPDRFYVVATRDLTIERDFAEFGAHLNDLKRRLMGAGHTVKESFKDYEATLRRLFGIKNRQALDLFSQAVSMKSVGNLTQFVREHMLEPFDVGPRVQHLIRHFDDLSRAHEAVLKAKRQMALLEPMVSDGLSYQEISRQLEEWQVSQEALPSYFAREKVRLYERALEELIIEEAVLVQRADSLDGDVREQQHAKELLAQQIRENGGNRLEELARSIESKAEEKARRQKRWEQYLSYANVLGLATSGGADAFLANRLQLDPLYAESGEEIERCDAQLASLSGDRRDQENQLKPLEAELTSLKKRRSNIDGRQVEIRRRLAADIGVREEDLPFAGELIQISPHALAWEGAIERLLHNFGLSMLVPELYYGKVTEWVEDNDLKGRLVYYRVRSNPVASRGSLHPQSAVNKVSLKPDSPFYAWLEAELGARFNYAAVDTLEEFRREPLAITKAGQIKGARDRHEKDDRHGIGDRKRFVLGWNNADKIAALEKSRLDLQANVGRIDRAMAEIREGRTVLEERKTVIGNLKNFTDYRDIDWGVVATEIARLEDERRELESQSDVLRSLEEQLARLRERLEETEQRRLQAHGAVDVNRNEQRKTREGLEKARAAVKASTEAMRQFPVLAALHAEHFHVAQSVDDCMELEQQMRAYLASCMKDADRRQKQLLGQVTGAMERYRNEFPVDSREMDARVEALAEYQKVLKRLTADDLPKFEGRFKKLLNENTIREIAQFQAQLTRERDLIRERVEQINRSLVEVDYNPGRYIRLDADPSPDRDVREFQQDLRACIEHSLTGSDADQYSEVKFLQVKAIVERFRGREGHTEQDRQWTLKVTDVRNEFAFSASERWREGDKEHEHYTDSGGKSGGQKEKLAYTILAASLAYQFGLDAGNPRTFRFVVIDEAFGRGSDESAQFGLELFRHLNLQLLVVTPLQKIHVIEPYVSSVGFVHNQEGRNSQIRNVTMEEFRAEREARRS